MASVDKSMWSGGHVCPFTTARVGPVGLARSYARDAALHSARGLVGTAHAELSKSASNKEDPALVRWERQHTRPSATAAPIELRAPGPSPQWHSWLGRFFSHRFWMLSSYRCRTLPAIRSERGWADRVIRNVWNCAARLSVAYRGGLSEQVCPIRTPALKGPTLAGLPGQYIGQQIA